MMLDNIKLLIGLNDTSKDGLINLQIDRSTKDVLNYCNIEALPIELEPVIEDMVVMRINRQGSEGVKSESIGPLTTTYVDDADGIPEAIKPKLNKFRRVKFR